MILTLYRQVTKHHACDLGSDLYSNGQQRSTRVSCVIPRSASAEVTTDQPRLITGPTAQHHPLLGEVVTVAGLLGAVTRRAGQHTEAAAPPTRVLWPGHLQGREGYRGTFTVAQGHGSHGQWVVSET